jgi:RNA polymerase sigma-70 factor (ECF subfamily)
VSESILQRIAAGDAAAVRECLDRHGPLVWSLVRRFVRDRAEAEDAAQEIFIALWKSAARFDPAIASEATFVAMVARRRLIDRTRAATRVPRSEPLEGALEVGTDAPRERLDAALDATRAARAFEALSPDQRRVLELAVLGGQTHQEIAQATGMPLGTVKSHARRGLVRMRELVLGPAGARRGEAS